MANQSSSDNKEVSECAQTYPAKIGTICCRQGRVGKHSQTSLLYKLTISALIVPQGLTSLKTTPCGTIFAAGKFVHTH